MNRVTMTMTGALAAVGAIALLMSTKSRGEVTTTATLGAAASPSQQAVAVARPSIPEGRAYQQSELGSAPSLRNADERAAQHADELWAGHARYDRDRVREATFATMAKDGEVIARFVSAFAEKGAAERTFGDRHREARVLGIRFLGYLDEKGHPEHIESALSGAIARLREQDTTKGLNKDVEDLTREYTSRHGDVLTTDPAVFVRRIGFHEAARLVVAQGVFDGLARNPSTMKERWTSAQGVLFERADGQRGGT